MIVSELIALLHQHPADAPVVIPASEYGYQPLDHVSSISVIAEHYIPDPYLGRYEDAHAHATPGDPGPHGHCHDSDDERHDSIIAVTLAPQVANGPDA